MKAPVSTVYIGSSCGLNKVGRLGHSSFGSFWAGFNNRKAFPRRFWANLMFVNADKSDAVDHRTSELCYGSSGD